MKKESILIVATMAIVFLSSCGGGNEGRGTKEEPAVKAAKANADPMKNKGIGPVSSVTLGPLDEAIAAEGKQIFEEMCTACHKVDKKFIGRPDWVLCTRNLMAREMLTLPSLYPLK